MTKEEAKCMSEVLKAWSEGKTVQVYSSNRWWDLTIPNPNFDSTTTRYRVKPEPKIRPYVNAEECLKDSIKHNGWVKYDGMYYHITYVRDICVGVGTSVGYKTFLKEYKWADDDSICGIIEKE